MTTIDCNSEMKKFHDQDVTLPESDQKEMRERRNSGRTRLSTGLKEDGHPAVKEFSSQGSYAMRTMVQDSRCDYDIDDGAYFSRDDLKAAGGADLAPLAARQRVRNALKHDDRLKHDAEVKTNCVRQEYPKGYHIDIPVYRVTTKTDAAGKTTTEFELASGDVWVKSDARAVTQWFKDIVGELNAGQSDGIQLRRVVRLTKKFARRQASWKQKTTSGICITKLVVDHFANRAGREDDSLRDTWAAIKSSLNSSLRIQHPVLAGSNLANEGDGEVAFFRDCLDSALTDLAVLDTAGCTRKQARSAWDKVFSTSFFGDQPSDDSDTGKKSEAFVVTSTAAAKRDDGGRRFG